jgi:hypothetical protein
MFKNEAPYLKEWIEYHLMVGAEHFWLYDNESTDNWQEVLNPYIKAGLVDVFSWPCSLCKKDKGNPWPFELQAMAIQDALRKARKNTTWFSFIDIDEFFLPKKDATIPQCLNNHFADASAVFVSWRCFGTNNLCIPQGSPILYELTARAVESHYKNTNGKTIVRPREVDIDQVYWVHTLPLVSNGNYLGGSREPVISDRFAAGLSWKVQEEFICLNHYFFRDDTFFYTRRLQLAEKGIGTYSPGELWNFHRDFCLEQNFLMRDFIEYVHPKMFKEFWSKPFSNKKRIYFKKESLD